MNIIEKIYCRIFQFCFKVAIPFLPYYNPEILDRVDDIPNVLKKKNIKRVLIVIDKSVRELGLSSRLELILEKNKIAAAIYDDIISNPSIDNVEEGRNLYLKNNCEALIAFGGGSAIDCAKGIGARIARPQKTIPQMAGILKIWKKTPLIFAIPTTAGTGSETTVAALITDFNTKTKYMIADFPLIPRYAVLDPENIKSLPPHITASVGMDVLVHSVEAYIGNSTTRKTRQQALRAVSLVYQNLEECYRNGENIEARRNMLLASYLAGCALSVSYVGYGHAISHALGGLYNCVHGTTNATVIPYVLEAYGKKVYKKLKELGIAAGLFGNDIGEIEGSRLFIKSIRDMNQRIGIPDKVKELRREDIKKVSSNAIKEANPIYPVPVLMGKDEISKICLQLVK